MKPACLSSIVAEGKAPHLRKLLLMFLLKIINKLVVAWRLWPEAKEEQVGEVCLPTCVLDTRFPYENLPRTFTFCRGKGAVRVFFFPPRREKQLGRGNFEQKYSWRGREPNPHIQPSPNMVLLNCAPRLCQSVT